MAGTVTHALWITLETYTRGFSQSGNGSPYVADGIRITGPWTATAPLVDACNDATKRLIERFK